MNVGRFIFRALLCGGGAAATVYSGIWSYKYWERAEEELKILQQQEREVFAEEGVACCAAILHNFCLELESSRLLYSLVNPFGPGIVNVMKGAEKRALEKLNQHLESVNKPQST